MLSVVWMCFTILFYWESTCKTLSRKQGVSARTSVFFFKASNWRGKKNPFSSCVRTFEGTFERSSLFWLQWRAVQWLQWNGKVNYIYIWKSCFCLTDLQSKIHICCFSIFLSSSASHSLSRVEHWQMGGKYTETYLWCVQWHFSVAVCTQRLHVNRSVPP